MQVGLATAVVQHPVLSPLPPIDISPSRSHTLPLSPECACEGQVAQLKHQLCPEGRARAQRDVHARRPAQLDIQNDRICHYRRDKSSRHAEGKRERKTTSVKCVATQVRECEPLRTGVRPVGTDAHDARCYRAQGEPLEGQRRQKRGPVLPHEETQTRGSA